MSYIVAMFLLLFAAVCFSRSEPKARESASSFAQAKLPPGSKEATSVPPAAPNALFPSVVAKVNGEAIPGRDLDALVRNELSAMGDPEWKDLRREFRNELILNNITVLINSRLLYQKAVASGIKATPVEVKAEMQKVAETFKNEAEMNETLARENTDRVYLEKSIYENLTITKYVDATVNKKVVVASGEAANYYSNNLKEFHHPEIVRTSRILIRAAGNAPEQDAAAKKRAEALMARLRKGEDFAALARENSMESSASNGGDIGFASRDGLAPEYSEAAFSLPLEGIKLIKTQYGYYIVKVFDKKQEGLFTLEEAKPQIHERLKAQKAQENLSALIKQLREKATIEILISAKELLNN